MQPESLCPERRGLQGLRLGTLHPSLAPARLNDDQNGTVPLEEKTASLRPGTQGDRQNLAQISADQAQVVTTVRGRGVSLMNPLMRAYLEQFGSLKLVLSVGALIAKQMAPPSTSRKFERGRDSDMRDLGNRGNTNSS